MSSVKYLRAAAVEAQRPFVETARRALAVMLRDASVWLARAARRLAQPSARIARAVPQLEFHAEAGAPEGALYLEGRLVGWISGVNRL